jgi:hypothetical protein
VTYRRTDEDGCDYCGLQREQHGSDGYCPGQRYSRVKYSEPGWWHDDGHRLSAVFSYGSLRAVLVHPEGGCTPGSCLCRGEESERDAAPDCPDCGGSGLDPNVPCWLGQYADDLGDELWESTDWIHDVPLLEPVPILYSNGWEDLRWRPRRPSQRPASRSA